MKKIIFFLFTLGTLNSAYAQTETSGWFFLSHTQKINEKFDILADAQLRSSDEFGYLSGLLLRTALSYNFNKKNSVAMGYAFLGKWDKEETVKLNSAEQRIYQQYLNQGELGKVETSIRLRLEQRFIKEDGDFSFSGRGRIFLGVQIPLFANSDFSRGIYSSLQNEIFLNLVNKNNINGSVFDQNRAFGSIGYRWSKKIDTEFGYMYWLQKENNGLQKNNVFQLMVTTSF